mmetsp:Transcript_28294/g.76648  ORF Transcript_28294/g.76648 Transcript_28294/m.76648 type:complete len:209 (-) Transcript_28294:151-777(-)
MPSSRSKIPWTNSIGGWNSVTTSGGIARAFGIRISATNPAFRPGEGMRPRCIGSFVSTLNCNEKNSNRSRKASHCYGEDPTTTTTATTTITEFPPDENSRDGAVAGNHFVPESSEQDHNQSSSPKKKTRSTAIEPSVGSKVPVPPGTLRPPRGPQARAPPQPPSLEGLLLKDLAAVLQKSQREVQEMTEDLQLEGKIYQNEKGEYLPL